MAAASPVELGRLAQEAAALAGAVRGCLGPRGGRALLALPTGAALVTRDGRRLLEALSLEPPTARMMVASACRHRGATGDGAKTFVVLLAAVLRGLRAAGRRWRRGGAARALRAFAARVLEPAAAAALRRPPAAAWRGGGGALEALLEAYLSGRVGPAERRPLARLCREYCERCAPRAAARAQALRLAGEHFAELHAAVAGLPLASSRVLAGLLLRRDFSAYCPAGGEVAAVVVTEPLHAGLAAPGVELVVESEEQFQACQRWIARRTEAVMRRLQSNNVKLLLSSVKQHEVVIYFAKLYSVSVVECLSSEEIALLRKITGISPFTPSCDDTHREITEIAVAAFCQPLLLGSERYVHLGFTSTCAFQPHCLILCGPAHGVNEQHAAAFQGAFKMLEQLFKTVEQREEWEAEGESQNETSDICGWHSSASEKQLLIENTSCNANQGSERQLRAGRGEAETQIVESDLQGSENPACVQADLQTSSSLVSPIKELSALTVRDSFSRDEQKLHPKWKHPDEVHKNCRSGLVLDNQKNGSTAILAAGNANAIVSEHLDAHKGTEKISCKVVLFKHGKSGTSSGQNYSKLIIEAGSVLPVGGNFEILLHYYIRHYAKQCRESSVADISGIIADALLSIPKSLYRTAEGNSFNKFYLKAIDALRKNEPLPMDQKGLESVYCKYQLVISVLNCITELLTIDLIIGVKRPLQKIEDNDSEDDF
ncbi:Bardet-Biedl syndrome 10 protein [Struthio camelus]|uniref:Bardet-Biedl syndrome 10 protein n=1 Tax=Struthio camelus TaxID=8801 RepID=UPI0036042DB2